MFIHFGIYSQLGGVWEGKQISRGLSEQIQAHAGIYSDTYAKVAKQFNPSRWNADSIALLAKQSGMKSIVITSKHHDGFAMFDSKHTEFDIMDATPYRKDVIGSLSQACERHGLKFGLYFSLIDWHYPQAAPISSHNSDHITPEHHLYNMKQITELLSNYGTVSELWFDMGSMSVEQSREMRDLVHRLQPNCMIGSRIGNDMGDFTVMGDNQEPDYVIGVPWQSPASFFDETWGYRSWQLRTDLDEKMKEKLISLINVVSRGGNYLLNIGPMGDGSVVKYEKEILLEIGAWLRKNEEAIYGAEPDPFHIAFPWGTVTSRPDKLYLHLMNTPADRTIKLPGLNGHPVAATVLGENTTCETTKRDDELMIHLPPSLNVDGIFKVVMIEFDNGYTVRPINILPFKRGMALGSRNAFKYYSNSGIDYNTRYTSTIKEGWTLLPRSNAVLTPELTYTKEEEGKEIDILLSGITQSIILDDDNAVPLKNDLSKFKFHPPYVNGPFESGIEGVHGDVNNVNPLRPWPNGSDHSWSLVKDWTSGTVYYLPGDMTTAYYVLQEIESKDNQELLMRVGSGDGVCVYFNGERLFIQNNPSKEMKVDHIIRLDVRKGKNYLLIKLFNNFQKEVPFSIDYLVDQVIYKKKLSRVHFTNDKYFPVSWKLRRPSTPHQDICTPNLRLRFD
jgi:alpha-L-fucosidase